LPASPPHSAAWRFEVSIKQRLAAAANDGRLFVILAHTNNPEPRFALGRTGCGGLFRAGAVRLQHRPAPAGGAGQPLQRTAENSLGPGAGWRLETGADGAGPRRAVAPRNGANQVRQDSIEAPD